MHLIERDGKGNIGNMKRSGLAIVKRTRAAAT
jgi:hypothetical protein